MSEMVDGCYTVERFGSRRSKRGRLTHLMEELEAGQSGPWVWATDGEDQLEMGKGA
jgi:hypothetical protein